MKLILLAIISLNAFFLGGCSVHHATQPSVVDRIDIQSSSKELQQQNRQDLEARLFGL